MARRTRLDDELLDLLADDPDLLAIADAIVETQPRRRRVRPAGLVAAAAVAVVATIAFVFWPGGESSGISGDKAYAAIGGQTRTLEVRVAEGAGTLLLLRFDRVHGRLSAIEDGRTIGLPAASLPPSATRLDPALAQRYGAGLGPVLSLVSEYPAVAKSGHLQIVPAPSAAWKQYEWVRYGSSLGYAVEVGLEHGFLKPMAVARAGGGTVMPIVSVYSSN
jgi:hypothetical protein